MIKGRKTSTTMVLSVLVLLIALLMSFINISYAWFTDGKVGDKDKNIYSYINMSEVNLSVYQQDSQGTETKLDTSSLPAGYVELDYVTSAGQAYFDTGIYLVDIADVKVELKYSSTTQGKWLFGSRSGPAVKDNFSLYLNSDSQYWLQSGGSDDTKNGGKVSASTLGTHTVKVSPKEFYYDGTSMGINTDESSISKHVTKRSFYIGALNDVGNVDSRINVGNIYYCKIYSGDNVKHNYVPCIKSDTNKIGLYDTIEHNFISSSGTGLQAGPETNKNVSLYYNASNKTTNLITPNVANNLKLILRNEDLGSTFGIKFKVEFYAATAGGRVKLSSSIAGMDAPSGTKNGFVLNADGYYYYQNSKGEKVSFESATTNSTTDRVMMTSFTINADSAFYGLIGGNSIIMVVDIENVAIANS